MSITTYFKRLDGFNNVVITCTRLYGIEKIESFRWVIDCDEFVYKLPMYVNWTEEVWDRAKRMYREQVKHVVQP